MNSGQAVQKAVLQSRLLRSSAINALWVLMRLYAARLYQAQDKVDRYMI